MNAVFKIESDVPMPATRHKLYPWPHLEVGESFFVERPADVTPNRHICRISSKASQANRRTGRVFRCRTMGNGVRVWGVA